MTKEIYVKSASAIVKICSDEKTLSDITNDDFFSSYIPSALILNNSEKFDAVITIKKSSKNQIKLTYPNIELEYIDFNPKDAISLTEYILERARQEKGIICVHGASAIVDGKAIVCWGPATGMGKTSLALKLSEDGMFYSDEKVLVDLINKKTVGRIKNQYVSNDYWRKKLGNSKYFVHENTAEDLEYEINLFSYGLICNQEEYIFDIWSSDKFLWHLYEESCRKIRGTSRMFFGNTYPVMSLDTEELAVNRMKLVKEFTKNVKAIYYKGNIEKAVQMINEFNSK